MTPEHQFLSESIDKAIGEFADSSLLGVMEAERKKFDYACVLQRDMNRPLISQVLWNNFEGIEKDLRTLLHDREAKLKLYVFKDSNRSRAKISEIIEAYKTNDDTAHLLRGLRLFPIPGDFDADVEDQQQWVYKQLKLALGNDIIFNILFGGLRRFDFDVFLNHGGPFGLKMAILQEVTQNGLFHNPTFKKTLGYQTGGPIRECLVMLNGIGLIKNVPGSNMYLPTIKGRLFLDLSRKVFFERLHYTEWSVELALILNVLSITLPNFDDTSSTGAGLGQEPVDRLLHAVSSTKRIFGRDLLANINRNQPQFHSDNYLAEIKEKLIPYIDKEKIGLMGDVSSLLFVDDL